MMLRTAVLLCLWGTCAGLRAQDGAAVFRSEVRLVEVYATVFDHKGRYLDGLNSHSFELLDNGVPQPIVNFESNLSDLSCAILLDTTGSMQRALPGLKNAVLRLIDDFREHDAAAVYAFGTSLALLQDFTSRKDTLKAAVLRTRAGGQTALFDAIAQTALDIGKRRGKKSIIVFTDGDDNASVLNASAALSRVKKLGIPIYSVAQGDALGSQALRHTLHEISQLSGGLSYTVKQPKEVESVFQDIAEDLQHGYLLTYKPPSSHGFGWRKIQLVLNGPKDCRIRAREGYLPE